MSPGRASRPSFASSAARRRLRAVAVRLGCAVAPLLLAACASAPPSAPVEPGLFDDAQFGAPREPIAVDDVLRMSPAMDAYLRHTIEPMASARGARAALTDVLYHQSQLEYESSVTRNAAQAFEARQGNCLSLVLMTGAFAKAMGLLVTYRQVPIDEMWSRSAGMYFMSGHVNIVLEQRGMGLPAQVGTNTLYTIDFMPGGGGEASAQAIDERTVLAMYMNNRAAEAMVAGDLDDAYWRLRDALRLDPAFVSAYNTLAVVYLRHGDPGRAERVLGRALVMAPHNPRLLANEADALARLGRDRESAEVREHLARVEPTPPFYWFVRGQAAMRSGDFEGARALFLKELDRAPDYHEFHYALAIADYSLGRLDEARSEMAAAVQDAVRRTDHDLYAAKLDKLRGVGRSLAPATQPNVQ